MSSTNKTTNLNLNQWEGTDRSQRTDFNEDNKLIDDWAGEVNSQLNDIMNTRFKNIFSITRNIKNKKVKIIGDSITAGQGGTDYNPTSTGGGSLIYGTVYENITGVCWANSLKTYLTNHFGCTVRNFGVSGINSTDIKNHITDLIKDEDDIIICTIGTNNRITQTGIDELIDDLKWIYNYANNLNKEIIFMSPTPTTPENDELNSTYRFYQMKNIENAIFETMSNLGIEYISIYKLFIEYLESRNLSLYSVLNSDGLHPNDKGYSIIYNLVLEALGFAKESVVLEPNPANTDWIELSFQNGVTPYSNYACQYRRIGNQVFIRGVITNISSQNTVYAVLPEGFRPNSVHNYNNFKNVSFSCVGFGVGMDGTLIIYGNADNTYNISDCYNINTSFLID